MTPPKGNRTSRAATRAITDEMTDEVTPDQTPDTSGSNRDGRTGQPVASTNGEGTGAGRKAVCGEKLSDGRTCELYKGHADRDGEPDAHMTVDISNDDVTGEFLSDDEIAGIVKSKSVVDEKQLHLNSEIARGWNEYQRRENAGASNAGQPVWMRFRVAAHKAPRERRMLAIAAETNNVGLKDGGSAFVEGGDVQIVVGILPRRAYDNKLAEARKMARKQSMIGNEVALRALAVSHGLDSDQTAKLLATVK
jgi:hypothetical protein